MYFLKKIKENIEEQIFKSDWGEVAERRYENPFPLNKTKRILPNNKELTINNVFLVDNPLSKEELFTNSDAVIKYLPLNCGGRTESYFYNLFSGAVGPEVYKETILKRDLGIELLMESGTSLKDLISFTGTQNKETTLDIAYESARLLEFIDHKGYIHGDIKPENILIVNRGSNKDRTRVVITDFEHTVSCDKFSEFLKKNEPHKRIRGTRGFIPPEIFKENFDFNNYEAIHFDMFSYGCLLYNLINQDYSGKIHTSNSEEYVDMMITGEYFKENYKLPISYNEEKILELILSCTEQDPKMRPSSFGEVVSELENFI